MIHQTWVASKIVGVPARNAGREEAVVQSARNDVLDSRRLGSGIDSNDRASIGTLAASGKGSDA